MRGTRRDPRPLGPVVESVAKSLAPETALVRVQEAWPAAVGDAVAAEARPVSERGGKVTVACDSAVWAQELELRSQEILDRLQKALESSGGCVRVTRLRMVSGSS
jgi:predicted nucleic acid-binding Zn ribbon protein